MELTTLWFAVIAFFWVGFLVLEGFDFGVGALSSLLGRDEEERGRLLSTIGPVWDGNEVWMVVAVGAMFAAFPGWYASMLSAFYLPLIVILLALIARGVALEWRGKRDDAAWKRRCDWALVVSSSLLPFLWGAVLAQLAIGVPLDADGGYVGGPIPLTHPYALFGGLTVLALCLFHGVVFLRLRTAETLRRRAGAALRWVTPPAVSLVALFALWTYLANPSAGVAIAGGAAAGGLLLGLAAAGAGRDGWAFAGTALAMIGVVGGLFASIFPVAMPSTQGGAYDLTVADAAAGAYGLRILSWAALAIVPAVLAYQAWAYWVFRQRVAPTATARVATPPGSGTAE